MKSLEHLAVDVDRRRPRAEVVLRGVLESAPFGSASLRPTFVVDVSNLTDASERNVAGGRKGGA